MRQDKIVYVVLDDDPTGVQVVSDVTMLVNWDRKILKEVIEKEEIFYILTNSRALSSETASTINEEIVKDVLAVTQEINKKVVFISRSDSTLRGHYPLEPDIIKETIESQSNQRISGELLIPFFDEGKRITRQDVHYIYEDSQWIPVSQTEYAKDDTFGYRNSNLVDYIIEKSNGKYNKDDIFSLSNSTIQSGPDFIFEVLSKIETYKKIICNVETIQDSENVADALRLLQESDKYYVIRCAPTFPKVLAKIGSKMIEPSSLVRNTKVGGLVVVGSHVGLTTKQLSHLFEKNKSILPFEVRVNKLIQPSERENEIETAINVLNKVLIEGKDICLFTSRTKEIQSDHFSSPLEISLSISKALCKIVAGLSVKPSYLCAKGGITSSDLLSKACNMSTVRVVGQLIKGVTVVKDISVNIKYENMPFIIFPGNVGEVDSLTKTIRMFKADN